MFAYIVFSSVDRYSKKIDRFFYRFFYKTIYLRAMGIKTKGFERDLDGKSSFNDSSMGCFAAKDNSTAGMTINSEMSKNSTASKSTQNQSADRKL